MRKLDRALWAVIITAFVVLFASPVYCAPTSVGTVVGFTTLAEVDCKYCFVLKPSDYFGCYVVANGVNIHIAQAYAQYPNDPDSPVTCRGDLEPGACASFTGTIVNMPTTSNDPPFTSYQLEVTSWTLLDSSQCSP